MSIKSMHVFNGMGELSKFSHELEQIKWEIEKEYLKDRAIYHSKVKLYIYLKQIFNEKNISIWQLKDEEIITWLDTLSILRRLSLLLFKIGIQTDKLSIVMEYPLIFGNHMRADYLLIYDHLIIVLEFGMFNQDERRSEERYTKKLQESNSYRQLLANLISSKIDVVNYVMIYRPEYSRVQKKYFDENLEYNNEELEKLKNFINHLIKKQDVERPLNQLDFLGSLK